LSEKKKGSRGKSTDSNQTEDKLEIITEASTRKQSGSDHSQDASMYNDDEDEDEDDIRDGVSTGKQLTPLEIKDHIEKLWNAEKDLLDLIYGKYCPV
jgi:primase-polymerase (primpol)-like protein